MTDLDHSSILTVASSVRERLLSYQERHARASVSGACLSAAFALALQLTRAGISCSVTSGLVQPGSSSGSNHWWVELGDSWFVDVTGDQFNARREEETPGPEFPPVLLARYADWPQYQPRVTVGPHPRVILELCDLI